MHVQSVQRLNSGTSYPLNKIGFIGDGVCIAAGGDIWKQTEILRSTDGGYIWEAKSYPDPGKAMFGMSVAPNGTMYLCGVDGDVLHSSDSGKSWQFNRIGDWAHYVGGGFPSPETGIFVSTVLQRQGTVTRVDANFNIIDQHTWLFGINDIYMVSPSTGYIIGYGTVMKTVDGGAIWNFMDVKGDDFRAMDIHGDEIWMCGSNGGIFHSADAGNHWQQLRNGNDLALPHYGLRTLMFTDHNNGWAAGDDGKLIHTDDAGRHWAEYDRFTTSALRSMALCPNGDLIIAGDNGSLYRITP